MGYLGSKSASGAYQAIIAHMPPHDTYIECYLGSGAVMKAKPPASRSIGIDIDGEAISNFTGSASIELVQEDCLTFLRRFDFSSAGRVLIYADPPYLHSTRSSLKRYKCEYSDEDHKRMIDLFKSLEANIIISGYPSGFYDKQLEHWKIHEYQVMTRGGPRTEKIWMNYTLDQVYCHTFAGTDHTDRQRIKRKAERWATKYRILGPAERLAIFSALMKAENTLPITRRRK